MSTDGLVALGQAGLAALLRARPDVLRGRAPRTLLELRQRLDSGPSLHRALSSLRTPDLQVLVVLAAEFVVERVMGVEAL